MNWNVPVDPASVATTDLQLSGNAGASVTAVTVTNGNMTTEFTLNIAFGGSLTCTHLRLGRSPMRMAILMRISQAIIPVEGCPPSQYVRTEGR